MLLRLVVAPGTGDAHSSPTCAVSMLHIVRFHVSLS
jgi:hypothetical protein